MIYETNKNQLSLKDEFQFSNNPSEMSVKDLQIKNYS